MALLLKALLGDEDKDAKSQVVEDATGLFVLSDNEGGYGTPNPDRAGLLLYLVATSSASYLGTSNPADATEFTFTYPTDGIFKFRIVGYEAATPPTDITPATLLADAPFVSEEIEHLCTLHLEAKMISLLDTDMADRACLRKNRAKYMTLEKILLSIRSNYSIGNPSEVERIIKNYQTLK